MWFVEKFFCILNRKIKMIKNWIVFKLSIWYCYWWKIKYCYEFLNVWRGGSLYRGKIYNIMMIKNKWFWFVDVLVWELG